MPFSISYELRLTHSRRMKPLRQLHIHPCTVFSKRVYVLIFLWLLLFLNSGSASFRGRIWRPITSQRCGKAVPIWRLLQMQPTNVAFLSLVLKDARLPFFVTSYIPRFFARPKKKKERKWRHCVTSIVTFPCLCGRNCDIRLRHLVTQQGNAPKARLSHLTTVDMIYMVSLKDSAYVRL